MPSVCETQDLPLLNRWVQVASDVIRQIRITIVKPGWLCRSYNENKVIGKRPVAPHRAVRGWFRVKDRKTEIHEILSIK